MQQGINNIVCSWGKGGQGKAVGKADVRKTNGRQREFQHSQRAAMGGLLLP